MEVAVSRDTNKVNIGTLDVAKLEKFPIPETGVRRYIVTSAQNNTALNRQCWSNLRALANHYDAQIMVAGYTYNIPAAAKGEKKSSRERVKEEHVEWWDSDVLDYLYDGDAEIAPGLIWKGTAQVLPTAVNPLSGYESMTGRASMILPHAKTAMASVASPKKRGTKLLYTTGTVTLINYIQKKAGQKAQFHHSYGALLVEVDSDGDWFVRQLNADSKGVIYDFDLKVDLGLVTGGHRPEAIVWGDIHKRVLQDRMFNLAWGDWAGSIINVLQPRRQVFHDLLDFRTQNHHDRDDSWKVYKKHAAKQTSVEDEINECADFLESSRREFCESLVVCSNHDMALVRWAKEADFREDPENSKILLWLNYAARMAIDRKENGWYAVEQAFRYVKKDPSGDWFEGIRFLRMDEEYIVCPDAGGGIELGMHGHKGVNGSPASLAGFARMGRKCIIGHSHTAGIRDGAYQVGVMGSLDQGYNEGPSSWSHTNCIVYPNGKRAMFTIYKGKWRA